jgi:DnaK suppressor protein
LTWLKHGAAAFATMELPARAGRNTDGMETAMNVDTQNHLVVLRGMLVFQLSEAKAELHALQRADAAVPAEARVREVVDRKDEAGAAQAFELVDATIERLTREVAQCERAMERLAQERYGDCADCGEPIPWARLMAQPAAERCADCQRLVESRSRGLAQA